MNRLWKIAEALDTPPEPSNAANVSLGQPCRQFQSSPTAPASVYVEADDYAIAKHWVNELDWKVIGFVMAARPRWLLSEVLSRRDRPRHESRAGLNHSQCLW